MQNLVEYSLNLNGTRNHQKSVQEHKKATLEIIISPSQAIILARDHHLHGHIILVLLVSQTCLKYDY